MRQVYPCRPNINSGGPPFALSGKGIAVEYHRVDRLKFEQQNPEYLARNTTPKASAPQHDWPEHCPAHEGSTAFPEVMALRVRGALRLAPAAKLCCG
jgi:hypothetical protein